MTFLYIVAAIWLLRALIYATMYKIVVELTMLEDVRERELNITPRDIRLPYVFFFLEVLRNIFFPFWIPRRFGDGSCALHAGLIAPVIRVATPDMPYQVLLVKVRDKAVEHGGHYLMRYESELRIVEAAK